MSSCAFVACGEATSCGLVGGCAIARGFIQPTTRIGANHLEAEGLRRDARALNGTEARPSRDPRFIKRTRKALTP